MAPAAAVPFLRLPEWLLKSWEEQGVPIDEFGRPDYEAMERIAAEKRAAADSMSARTEEGQGPDVTLASKTALRFD